MCKKNPSRHLDPRVKFHAYEAHIPHCNATLGDEALVRWLVHARNTFSAKTAKLLS